MTNVEPEEAEAIRDLVQVVAETAPVDVQPRDFAEPRRLSVERISVLSQSIGKVMKDLRGAVGRLLREERPLTLSSLVEVNVSNLFEELETPRPVLCFECCGEPGWLIWDCAAAVAATEILLTGTSASEPTPRELTPTERTVVEQLLTNVALTISHILQVDLDNIRLVQDADDLPVISPTNPGVDTQRLLVQLAFEGPGQASDLCLYLPGITRGEIDSLQSDEPKSLPAHMANVELEVCANLGTVEVLLTDLLKLEIGDVIPLGVPVDSTLEVSIENGSCARARWGKHHGNLAIQIEEIDTILCSENPSERNSPS